LKTLVVSSRLRAVVVCLVALCTLLLSGVAAAAGRVEWKSKELDEREGGSWRLEIAIFLPRAPDVAHVPMKFEFQPIAYFERSMVDGDKLIERTVPLENRQALIESVDVGFLDAGSGKTESRTRFTFKVTRAHGYEAGEYKVTIKDGRNGQTVGTATTLKFKGQNEVIDRRAMVFSGEKKKKKKDDAAEGGEKKADESATSEKKEAEPKSDDAAEKPAEDDAGSSKPSSDDAADNEKIKEKPGGCGCHLEASGSETQGSAALALLVGAAVVARRRKRTSKHDARC
jgi:MYXO-CTERM domain-containing protein